MSVILLFHGNDIYSCVILMYSIYACYLILLLVLVFIWRSIKLEGSETTEIPITVIVPFRNEVDNLNKLVGSLEGQSHTDFEAIFVNDHSDDQSEIVLHKLLSSAHFNHKILKLTDVEGKKAAISFALDHAANDLVITTDADCEMGPHWLKEMSQPFVSQELKMLVGPIGLTGNTFWKRMQSIESSALIGVGGAMLHLEKPLMANGANLAYRKAVFNEVNGFEGISSTPSGDDELLMDKVFRHYPSGIQFLKLSGAMVYTDGLGSWREFRQQRLRWSSKWKVGKRMSTQLVALFVFLIQLVQLGLIGAFLATSQYWEITLLFLIGKFLIELIFLWSVRRSLGQKMYWIPAGINYLLYPFYAIYFGVAANFGKFEWKGRSYKVNN